MRNFWRFLFKSKKEVPKNKIMGGLRRAEKEYKSAWHRPNLYKKN
jgi:hypothetical protein